MSRSGVYWWILVEARTLRIRHPRWVPFLFNYSAGEKTHSGAAPPLRLRVGPLAIGILAESQHLEARTAPGWTTRKIV